MNGRLYHLRYTVITIGYIAAISILSEIPGQGSGQATFLPDLPDFLWNSLHVPLFFGFAWCLLMNLSGGQWNRTVPLSFYGIVWFLAAACAVFDEWHQSFVPGRFASTGDFFLDCVGIAGLLFVHRLDTAAREPRQPPHPIIGFDPRSAAK